ncbi:MAG: exodeoxyribonuclease III [Bacteroidia bacterium]|nr:exodeoxyribonuclease III [Bacteroidia bacterium]MDW8157796.1 exodeoxyribonuclease III [Bacteroidia bacterium]
MIRIVSFNVNGIRAAIRKGLKEWITRNNADIYCLQEIKADKDILAALEKEFTGYQCYFFPAQKKGYSGIGVLSRYKPQEVVLGVENYKYDQEGRAMYIEFDTFRLANLYLPSGSQGIERQIYKEAFMEYLLEYTQQKFLSSSKSLIIVGDFNICHQAIDIHNPQGLKNTSGFLPHERAWFSEYLGLGLVDSFRYLNKEPGHYTWWTYRTAAKLRNKGWRIDYQLITPDLEKTVISHVIHREVDLSDHSPIELTLGIDF